MPLIDALLPEFDQEVTTTRRLLDRLPDGQLAWQPHPKSMSLASLAAHLSELGYWGQETLNSSAVDLEKMTRPAGYEPPATRAAVLAVFDEKMAAARAALVGKSDDELMAPWTLRRGAQEFFTMPKASCWRTFVMNHLIHHRGQLTVYLRQLDVPLPSIYGPSADEQPF
ncbi:MAG TPA: DinB family protein [Vicinamibacterales bacterium]|nr:DinB family protein [Vicinamibacterales bacterium]